MIKQLLENQEWLSSQELPQEFKEQLSATQMSVLLVQTPLTRFIENRFGLRLDVQLHDQYMCYATEAEAGLLGIDPHDRCLRRKVSLVSRNEPMFDAESVLPWDVLPLELMQELEEGKRPLANLLSERGLTLSRTGLSISQIHEQGNAHEKYNHCWARRSVLSSQSGAKALVTEVFLDALWRKLNYLQSAR